MTETVSADICSALEIVWPSNAGPEATVKRAAAEYLLANHPQGTVVKAVLVASHVTTAVGKVSSLGITKKFEQLLIEDPCFTVERHPFNNLVALDTTQLLSQSSWRRDEQLTLDQQWQQPPQQQQHLGSPPGLGSSSSSTDGRQGLKPNGRLLQGLNTLWPREGPAATPETKVKHTALFQLLKRPNNTMEWFALAFAVSEALGCVDIVQDLGCVLPMDQLLQQEPSIFVFERSARGSPMPAVALDAQGVLNRFLRGQSTVPASPHEVPLLPQALPLQQQQRVIAPGASSALPEQQHVGGSVQGVAPDSGIVSAASLLQYVRGRQWHSSDPVLGAVRRALAERMVLKVNTAAAKEGQQPAKSEAKWYNMLGSLAGYTIGQAVEGLGPAAARSPPSLEECVDQDPYLSIYFVGEVQHIKLDIEQLLQDAAAAMTAQQLQNRLQRRAAAAPAGGSIILRRVGDAAAAGASSSRQAANGPAVNGASSSTAHAGAAARGVQQVSVGALRQHVSSRVWHSSNPQLDLARRALAQHLVSKANEVLAPDCRVNADVKAYRDSFAQSGLRINQALKSHFGNSVEPCYKKLADVFTDDPCWQVLPPSSTGGQKRVQLNLPLLLQEAATLLDASSGIGSNSGSSSHGVLASANAATAAVARAGSGAASSSGSSRPAAVRSPAVAPAAAASSAEAAMAAIKAAARSLMPPAVKSPAVSAAAAAPTPAVSAGLDAAAGPGSSSSTPMAAPQPSTDTASAGVELQNPFLPFWMRGIGAGAAPAVAETAPQQQEPLAAAEQQLLDPPVELLPSTAATAAEEAAMQQESLSVTAAGPSDLWVTPTAATPTEEQLNGTASMLDTATADADVPSSSGSEEQQQGEVPLQYELLLSNSVPGWYTASYLPYDSSAGAGAAGACITAQGTTGSSAEPAADVGSAAGGSSSSGLCSPVARPDQTGGPEKVIVDLTPSQCEALATIITEGLAERMDAKIDAATAAAPAADGGGGGGPKAAAQQQQQYDQDHMVLLEAVPDRMRMQLEPYLAAGPDQPHVTHIILDSGRPVTLRLSDRTSVQLDTDVTLTDALQHLVTLQQQWAGKQWGPALGSTSAAVSGYDQLQNGTNGTSDSSSSVAAATHPNGGLSALNGCTASSNSGGCSAATEAAPAPQFEGDCQAAAGQLFGPGLASCLGVPGSCHRVCCVQDAAGGVCGVTYCLQAAVPGAAAGLADVLSGMKASLSLEGGLDRPRSLLVLGRPGVGKTCLLRDMCRLMSSSTAQGGLGLHVMLLDTTGGVAGLRSQPTPHIGAARVVPVPDRSQQARTMARIARSHQPDVLVVGELATQQEAAAAVSITRSCNVLLVAAAPASSLHMLLQDSMLCHLVGCEKLRRADMQRALPCPFSIAVELLGKDRCCVHTDLEASSDDLMLQLSSGNKKGGQGQAARTPDAAPDVHAQLRSRDSSGRLVVQFGSVAAAGAALADAAIVEVIAQNSAADV